MPTDPTPGLRDRKRAETRARIEAAAVELASEVGLAGATVELISERAGVSPRTFFNYFETKDAAILGLRPAELDEQAIEEHLASPEDETGDETEDDPIVAVVRLVMTMIGAVDPAGSALHRRRVKLLRQHPEIIGSQFAHLDDRKNRLMAFAVDVLVRHPRFAHDPDAALRAPLVLALCGSAVRAAVDEWTQQTGTTTSKTKTKTKSTSTSTGTDAAAVEARAVDLVHSTLRRLT